MVRCQFSDFTHLIGVVIFLKGLRAEAIFSRVPASSFIPMKVLMKLL
jgi:hypothetical protein